jgi:hypothetical protein
VFEFCSKANECIYRVRSKEEIQSEWFEGVHVVAILGGILVPHWSIEETAWHVRALCSYLRSRVYFLIARRKPHPRQEVIGAAVKPHPHPSIKRKVRRNKINEPSHGILLRAG